VSRNKGYGQKGELDSDCRVRVNNLINCKKAKIMANVSGTCNYSLSFDSSRRAGEKSIKVLNGRYYIISPSNKHVSVRIKAFN